jgi:2-polyprenyl-6-methoxyphenol hydroxylase-like FAD-dependent oxidoreductase
MKSSTDVLVVGAGPVGLTLAGELQRRGIDHQIIDRRPRPEYFCKAVGVSPRTLEVWDQIGVLEEALRAGLFAAGVTVTVNGREGPTETAHWDAMPYGFLLLPQYETERILREYLFRHGGRVQHAVALLGLTQTPNGVRARVAQAGREEQTVECRYVVGCDGTGSVVRRSLGLEYERASSPLTFMLGDVRVQWDRPRNYVHRFVLMADGELENVLICTAVPGDPARYRVSVAVPPRYLQTRAAAYTPPTLAVLAATIAPMLPADTTVSDLRWSCFYRVGYGIVPRYGSGSVFLAGDAAHMHPPIGAQGMNTGIQDAHNLAWKLALVLSDRTSSHLLESYDAERRPVGEEVVDRAAHRADHALWEQDDLRFDQSVSDSQLFVHYRDSPWVVDDVTDGAMARGPQAGDRAVEARGLRRAGVREPVRLKELLRGSGHTLLFYFDRGSGADVYERCAEMADVLQVRYGRQVVVYGIVEPGGRIVDFERFPLLADAAGDFKATYDVTGSCLHLIRPDAHVGYRSDRIDAERLETYLRPVFADS